MEQLCDPINLLDAKERQQILEDHGKKADAEADMIASATRHAIEQEMAKDPAFYSLLTRCLPDWRQRKEALDKFRPHDESTPS